MIRSARTTWAKAVFVPVIEGLLRTRFSHFYLADPLPAVDPSSPLLLTPNHFSWWDGFFFYHLLRHSGLRSRKPELMMLESQLKKHWYFKHLGAFSIAPGNRSALESVGYASERLRDRTNVVVVYPQGELRSYAERPVALRRGVARILRGADPDATVLPVFFKVEYWDRMKPEVWCGFGAPWRGADAAEDFAAFEAAFNRGIAGFDARVGLRKSVADLFKDRA